MPLDPYAEREARTFKRIIALVASAIAGLAFLVLAFSTYFTIDQGERGVILHNGAVAGLAEPGLHFKMPWVTTIAKISVQTETVQWHYQDAQNDSRMQAYSKDQQPATIAISVNYHVVDPVGIYSQFGSLENFANRVVVTKTSEQFKNVFGQFDAVKAIQDRAKLNAEVTDAVQKAIRGPVVVDSVQVQDISFSNTYEKAVEARMEATVKEQQAIAQKNQRMTNADAAAYEVKAAADAKAHAVEVAGAAEATAIKAKGEALRENPGLPSLVTAEAWDGHLPQTMPPGGSVPFLKLN